jgi:hypothetical protein
VPVLRGELKPGKHLLVCAVWAGPAQDYNAHTVPQFSVDGNVVRLSHEAQETPFTLPELP